MRHPCYEKDRYLDEDDAGLCKSDEGEYPVALVYQSVKNISITRCARLRGIKEVYAEDIIAKRTSSCVALPLADGPHLIRKQKKGGFNRKSHSVRQG